MAAVSTDVIELEDCLGNQEHVRRTTAFIDGADNSHPLQFPWLAANSPGREISVVMSSTDEELCCLSVIEEIRSHFGLRKNVIRCGPAFKGVSNLQEHIRHLIDRLPADVLFLCINPHVGWDGSDQSIREINLVLDEMGFRCCSKISGMHSATILVDTEKNERQLFASLRPGLRRQLRKSDSIDIEIVECNGTDSGATFAKHFAVHAFRGGEMQATVKCHLDRLHAENQDGSRGLVWLAKHNAEVVGGIACIRSKRTLRFLYGFSNKSSEQRIPMNHMLHWRAILWCIDRQLKYYDLGGYWQEKGKSDAINRFKLAFSPNVVELPYERVWFMRPVLGRIAVAASNIRFKD